MAFIVTEHCEACKYTDCVDICPVDCFHEGDNMLYINPDECIDCGACVAECPVEAIYDEDNLPKKYEKYKEINRLMSSQTPQITEKKAPLPGAKSLEEWQSQDLRNTATIDKAPRNEIEG